VIDDILIYISNVDFTEKKKKKKKKRERERERERESTQLNSLSGGCC